jgi:hypothetical protein
MHLREQGKGRPDVGTMLERATAAIDDDLPVAGFVFEQRPELPEVIFLVCGPRFHGPFDQAGGPYADDKRWCAGRMADTGGQLGRIEQLGRYPWVGLAGKGAGDRENGRQGYVQYEGFVHMAIY